MQESQDAERRRLSRRNFLLLGGTAVVAGSFGAAVANLAAHPNVSTDTAVDHVDVTGDFNDAFARAKILGVGRVVLQAGESVTLDRTVSIPDFISDLVIEGDVIVGGDFVAFDRRGQVLGDSIATGEIGIGDLTIDVDDTSSLRSDDWLLVFSDDIIPGGVGEKAGALRQVAKISGKTVTVDASMYRKMSTRPRLHRIDMAPAITIRGAGSVSYADPNGSRSAMIEMQFAAEVRVGPALRLHDGGGSCVRLQHVAGARISAQIDNFLDVPEDHHFGYGVNLEGATRDVVVDGQITRCRHAVTTNTGPDLPGLNYRGEPENCLIRPVTSKCTNKALDSHRPGWRLNYVLRDTGSAGGLTVRADAVTADISAVDTENSVLAVFPNVTVPPVITSFRASGCKTTPISIASDVYFARKPVVTFVSGIEPAEVNSRQGAEAHGV